VTVTLSTIASDGTLTTPHEGILMARPAASRRLSESKGKRPLRKPVSRTPAWLPPVATLGGLALLVVAFLAIRWATTPATTPAIGLTTTQLVVSTISTLPPTGLEQVGLGSATNSSKVVTGTALTGSDGKPVVFYLGAEYCPYCAAERWPMIIALSRFGTFSGLQTTTSSSSDIYPNTPTFTFRSATFTSQYIDFQAVETADRDQKPLQSPTAEQAALATRYGNGGIPFIDFGNRYAISGATYLPDILAGMTWQQVADSLKQPDLPQARAILGSANLFTAAICQLTGQKPATACSGASIQAIEGKLGAGH
jgi:thiol-disulfide isomerase/thioredoxin